MDNWIDKAIVDMHKHRITQTDVAQKCGCTREFINKVLNRTKKAPTTAETRITTAINQIIEERNRKFSETNQHKEA